MKKNNKKRKMQMISLWNTFHIYHGICTYIYENIDVGRKEIFYLTTHSTHLYFTVIWRQIHVGYSPLKKNTTLAFWLLRTFSQYILKKLVIFTTITSKTIDLINDGKNTGNCAI